jgi:methylated-DNA-[protein]-cysteine S-methyltransferase
MHTKATRYTLFKTRWGHFGFVCRDDAVCRTLLPVSDRAAARQALSRASSFNAADIPFEKDLCRALQQRIAAYFEGENVDFSTDPPVDLTDLGPFQRAVLLACRQIGYGETRTYAQLASNAGRAKAARAVGTAMARNPVPLIVPCHRVVRADGGLGGFSALGGITLKQQLLRHEQPAGG